MASEYLKWKYRDVKPDEPVQYTAQEKRRNWFFYHKWHIVIGVVLVLCLGDVLWHVLGIGQVMPDYQVAYVGAAMLPDDTVAALEDAIAGLGQDCNGDGRVAVKLNQYVTAGGSGDAAEYAAASTVMLMGDLSENDSYFFLLEDPDRFQREYGVLRRLDGTLPTEDDEDYENCYIAWDDCPALAGLDLGDYTVTTLGKEVTGHSRELLSGLYVARRGFWMDETSKYPEQCGELWDALTEGALS